MSKRLTRTPSFGVIVSKSSGKKRVNVSVSGVVKREQNEEGNKDLSLAINKKSQRRIINNLFLTRQKTSELFSLLEEEC